MIKTEDRTERFLDACRAHGLKITPQRMAIFKALDCESADHPSADSIHRQIRKEFPAISLDTVNRTLLTFSKIGLVTVVEGHGDPRRFDPNLEAHHHFYCLSCRKIFDFHDQALADLPIPESVGTQFTVTGKRICLEGYCRKCQTDKNPEFFIKTK